MTGLVRSGVVQLGARANCGRWIADCVWCNGALGDPHLPFGAPAFVCPSCQSTTEVLWPSDEMRAGVERLLMMRPDPVNRNWEPGETLIDLMVQNAAHGIFDLVAVEPGQSALSVTETSILVDELPPSLPRQIPQQRKAVNG